ncbi:MAG: tetratricopeptide repeat protein [Myxococcales bacterium]
MAWKTAGTTRMEACTRCGGFAHQLKIARGEVEPFDVKALLAAARWPFSPVGILCIAATTALATVLGLAGAKGSFIATGVIVAYLFQIVRHTARGGDDFPGPDDFQGYFEDVVGPSLRLTVALAWIWVPALVFTIWSGPRRDPVAEQQQAMHDALKPGGPGLRVRRGTKVVATPTGIEVIPEDAPPPPPSPELMQAQPDEPEAPPVVEEATPAPKPSGRWIPVVLVLLGIGIAPMSLLASALKTPLTIAANPLVLIFYAAKLGKDYALLVGFCVAIVGLTWLTDVFGSVVFAAPLLGSALRNLEKLALAFGAFRGIGLLVRSRGAELGYGGEEAYMVPALGDAQPRGTLAPPPPPRQEPPLAPIELPPESPKDPSAEMVKAIAQNDDDACLALVEEHGVKLAATAASPERWMNLARLALERRTAKSAAVCLRRCLDAAPGGPLAPQAWLLAARVYDEHLGDRATSNRLLGELAKRFPSSKEGAFATKRLAQLAH